MHARCYSTVAVSYLLCYAMLRLMETLASVIAFLLGFGVNRNVLRTEPGLRDVNSHAGGTGPFAVGSSRAVVWSRAATRRVWIAQACGCGCSVWVRVYGTQGRRGWFHIARAQRRVCGSAKASCVAD